MKLLCYFPAEKPIDMEIDIDAESRVCTLIKEIYKELMVFEYDVALKELELYKSDIPIEPLENQQERVLNWLHNQTKSLNTTIELSDIFPDKPDDDNFHIIIATPEVKEICDVIHDPEGARLKRVKADLHQQHKKMLKYPAPSSIVNDPTEVKKFLGSDDQLVCIDRIPAVTFSPPLARLQKRLGNLGDVDVTLHEVDHAYMLHRASVAFYDIDNDRQDAIKYLVDALFRKNGRWRQKIDWAGSITPDAHWFVYYTDFPIAILESKNTIGLHGDPFLQAVVDYTKIVSAEKFVSCLGSCNFPVVLLGISGSRIDVGVAVCVGSVYASRLVTLDLSSGFHLTDNIIRLARTFKCISLCLDELGVYYSEVGAKPKKATISALFPNPTPIASIFGDSSLSLKYRGTLSPRGEPDFETVPHLQLGTTALYVADTTIHDAASTVIVKFTSRYNVEAHKLLSDAGLAPKLYSCQLIVGGLYMVVMDYVQDAKSVWLMRNDLPRETPPENVLDQVERAIQILHDNGLVYGDLRDTNIICLAGMRAMLVDFDWAGKDGEARYPASVNTKNNRHNDVRGHAEMRKEHDLYQLKELKKQLYPST